MRCEVTQDAAEFMDLASEFLLRDPIVNNVLLTTVSAQRRRPAEPGAPPSTFAVVRDGAGAVAGAAMRTPPAPIYLSPMPLPAIEPLLEAMLIACPDAAGITATSVEAEAFASSWARRTGAPVEVWMRQRMFRLDSVTPPISPPGGWRRAIAEERDLLVRWREAFAVEAGEPASADPRRAVEIALEEGRAFLWVDGGPVSYTGTSQAPELEVVRVGPVYTPPVHRGHGYASALVAAVSQQALDAGAVACMLFTDLANQTSNRIYGAVGYRPVRDVAIYRFGPAAAGHQPPVR